MKVLKASCALLLLALGASQAAAQHALKVAMGQINNWENQAPTLGEDAGIFKKHDLKIETFGTQGAGETIQVSPDGDEELRLALWAVREALGEDGRFVFETRNPAARAWEAWTPKHVREVDDGHGGRLRVWHEVEEPLHGDRVTFTTTCEFTTLFEDRRLHAPRVSRSTLRFLDATALAKVLAEAGLTVTEQYGDWGRGPLGPGAPEIITVARVV